MDSGLGYFYLAVLAFAAFFAVGFSLSLAIGAHDLFIWLIGRSHE